MQNPADAHLFISRLYYLTRQVVSKVTANGVAAGAGRALCPIRIVGSKADESWSWQMTFHCDLSDVQKNKLRGRTPLLTTAQISSFCFLIHEVRNTTIREELQIFNISERIQSRKIEWHEHLSRVEQQRIAQQVMFYKPIGYRDIGHPRRREDTF
jgi:hypothetical protein